MTNIQKLNELLEQELWRTGLLPIKERAQEMAGPLADWMSARFVEWAQNGMETWEGNDYWSQQVEL